MSAAKQERAGAGFPIPGNSVRRFSDPWKNVAWLLMGLVAANLVAPALGDTYNGSLQWHTWSTNNAEGTMTCNPTTNGQIQYQARYIVTNPVDEIWMKWEWNWWNKQVAANGTGFTSSPNNSVEWDSRVRMGGTDWVCANPVDIHVGSTETGKWYIFNITDTGTTLADSCNDSMAAFAVNEINHVGTLVTFGTPVASNDLNNLYLDSRSTAEQTGSNEELWFMYTTNDWTTRSFVEITSIGNNTVLTLPIGSAVKFGSVVKWLVGTFANTDTNTIQGTTSGVQNFDAGAIEKYVARQHYVLRTLLENPSFEVPPTTNAPHAGAYHWKYGDPDTHGNYSNTASREEWRAHSDYWEATIRGTWAGGTDGAWWQEVTNQYDEGTIWEAGAWVWNDNNFTSAASRIKVEFYDGSGTRLGGNTNTFSNPGETWTYYSVAATAGANVAWVRWHIEAVGVSANGSLQIDDAVLWPSAPPVVTNYSINGGADVTDGQITGGTFSVVHWMHCADGIETTNTIAPYFQPNFDILNPNGVEILTDKVYASFTYQATGTTVVASNSSHSGASGSAVVLGVYTTQVSMISSNAAAVTNTVVMQDGTAMTFTVVDDDTAVPRVSWENLIGNPGFETNAAGWSTYGSGFGGADSTNGESSSGCIYMQEQGDGGYYRDGTGANDTVYILTVRARKEATYDVANNYVKLEFRDSGGGDLGNANELNVNSLLTTNWQTFSVMATSPASGVAYVRAVIGVWDVGGSGSARAYFDNVAVSRYAPLKVMIGSTNYSASDLTTNAYIYLTDGDLAEVGAANPLRVIFGAYDVDSGLSRGTADPNTQMNVDITNSLAAFVTDDVAHYDSSESSAYADTFEGGSTSTWKWTSLSDTDKNNLMGTNRVTASLFDADNDRSDDRAISTNHQFGFLVVTDDDPSKPSHGFFGTNMLTNPGFETNAAGWGGWDDYGNIRGVADYAAEDGSYGVWLTNYDGGGAGASAGWQQMVPAEAEKRYAIAIRARKVGAMDPVGIFLKCECYTNNGTVISSFETNIVNDITTEWRTYAVDFTTPVGTVSNKFLILVWNDTNGSHEGIAYFDNAVMVQASDVPMKVQIGTTNYSAAGDFTNAMVTVTDGDLAEVGAANPFRLRLAAYDRLSGLSRGNTDPNTQMNVDIGSWKTDDVGGYYAAESSDYTNTFAVGATSTWRWTSFSTADIDSLMGTNRVTVSIMDTDNDRTGDRGIVTNQQFGYLAVVDDDTTAPFGGNMLFNPGFEIGAAACGPSCVEHWSQGNPDYHGGYWGNVNVESWRSHSGTNEASIRDWSAAHPSGGWWQEVPCSGGGVVWYAEAWFWNDSNYTNTRSELRIDFYDSSTQIVGGATNSFALPGETWTKVTLVATSAANSAWARVVIAADGQGQDGALQFDDVVLQPVRPLQIKIGSTYLDPSDYTTNAKFYVDVNALTNVSDSNPFYLIFNAHDPESGLSRGTTDPNTQMNVDFQNVSTDNVANFVLTNSSPDADTDLTTATNVWVWYSFTQTQIEALTNSVTNLIAATLFNADNEHTGDREAAINLQFGYLVVTGSLPRVRNMVIDGNTNDWFGTPPAVVDSSTISSNEFIWRDKEWEERTDPEGTNEVNNDLWELRIYADASNVYFMARFQDITPDLDYTYLAIGVDSDRDPADTNMNWIGDDSGVSMGDGYFTNGNAAMHYPERQIIVHTVQGVGQRIELYADDGTSWYTPSQGTTNSDTYWNAGDNTNLIEFKINRADLNLTGDVTARFMVATFENAYPGGWANDKDTTTNFDTCDALDTISITPYGINDGDMSRSAWEQEISDGDLDFYFEVYLSATGMAPNVLPEAPTLIWPTNGAVLEKGAGPFEWTVCTDTEGKVTSYLLEISTNANFNGGENGTIFYRANIRHTNDPNWIATSMYWSVTNLLDSSATQFYWRVRARDLAGALSGISATNMFQFTDADDDTEGPVATLVYVGTNYVPGSSPIKTNIYDGELADTNNPVDIAVRWYDPSGVFLTNHPPHASDNIYSEWGRVTPNWDVADVVPGVSTTYYGWDEVFTNFSGYNGATSVTTYNHNAFYITNLDLTHEYYLTVSAEDEDNDKGTQPDPDSNGDPIPIDRSVTTNQQLSFRIVDDDTTYPTIFGSTNLLQNPGFEDGTNYWTWTDYVYFQGYAAYAGTNGVEFVTGAPTNAWGNIWQGFTNASPSNIYKMAFYARKQSNEFYAGRVYMKLEFWDGSGNMITSNQIDILPDLTTNWQLFTHAAAAPTGTVEVRASFGYDWGSNPVTRLFVDSVDLTEAPPPLGVKIGSTNYPGSYDLGAVASTNAIYTVTDGDLAEVGAANPLDLSFRAYDADDEKQSGLSRGTTDSSTQMNISVENLTTNNVAQYNATKSSADSTDVSSTSVWSFTSISSNSIGAMFDAGSNAVRATLRDADFDRVDDQLSVTNVLFGYLRVIDDDTNAPELSGFGVGSSTNLTDAELAAGLTLTGMVRDTGSGINSNSVATGNDFGVNYDIWSTNGEILADQMFEVAPADGEGTVWTGVSDAFTIPYSDRVLGPWTARVSVSDYDWDRPSDNATVINSNVLVFNVYDDDAVKPRLHSFVVSGHAVDSGTLSAGDIAIIGYHSDTTKHFAFVPLVNLPPATEIKFTDIGWDSSTTNWGTASEGRLRWTSPSNETVAAGTVISITNDNEVSLGTIEEFDLGFSLSTDGDQILAYQGDESNPSFIFAINANSGGWQDAGPDSDKTALPPGLTEGESAINIGTPERDNGYYTNGVTGTKALLSTSICAYANWTVSDDALTFMDWAFSVTVQGTVEITDSDMAGGLSFTGLVQDTGSGIYAVDSGNNAPTLTIYNTAGTVVTGRFFETGPAANGDAKSSPEGLAATGVVITPSINEVWTARVAAVDYDDDRPSDSSVAEQFIALQISDDDTTHPTNGLLMVMVDFAEAPVESGAGTSNVVYQVSDGDLAGASATNPVFFSFNVWDASGINRGTNTADTNLNVSIDGICTNDVAHFSPNPTSSVDTTTSDSTSLWAFTSFSQSQIDDLFGTTGDSHIVKANIPDADSDRAGDSLWRSNVQFGFIHVIDDDTNAPAPGTEFGPGNLLRNSSFEQPHISGDPHEALYWTWDERSTFYRDGGYWGTASRESWREYPEDNADNITNCAAIRGTWCGVGTNTGGFWQQVPNEAGGGSVWEASAWVWSDSTWTSGLQTISLEFWDEGASNLLQATTNVFDEPGETWTYVAVTDAAPAGAAYARWVIGAWDVGATGALSIDSVSLRVLTNTTMDIMIGLQSFYRTGYGSNAIFRLTDGDLATIGPTNPLKFIFNVYDADSGLLRSTNNEYLNYDIGSPAELQNIYSNWSEAMSSADTTSGNSTSVFVHTTNFTLSYDDSAQQTGMVWALMGYQDEGGTNAITLSGPDADNDRSNDKTWFIQSVYGYMNVYDDDTDGPFHWLVYVGSNFTWGSYNTGPISDEEMLHFQFAYGIWDASGILVTNHLSGSTNVSGEKGEIAPNWDLVNPAGTVLYENLVPASNQIFSPSGNGSYNATVVVQNITITYEQNTIGIWRIRGSAQDMDWDRGTFVRTNDNGGVETASWDRAFSGDWAMEFTVYDDDTIAPVPGTTNYAQNSSFTVLIGSTMKSGSGSGTNRVITVYDGDLASVSSTNAMHVVFNVYDQASGIKRGTNSAETEMNVSIDGIATNDVEHYNAAASTADTTVDYSTSVWTWTEFTKSHIDDLFGATGDSHLVTANIPDADDDRVSDSQWNNDQQFGWIWVRDDDEEAPRTQNVTRVYIGGTEKSPESGTGLDRVFVLTEGEMADLSNNPLEIHLKPYDSDSGIARGTNGYQTNMHVTIEHFTTNDVEHYDPTRSCSLEETKDPSTSCNVWRWAQSYSYDELGELFGETGWFSAIEVTVPDTDDDRTDDRLWLSNQVFGYIHMQDDDIVSPTNYKLMDVFLWDGVTNYSDQKTGGSSTNQIFTVSDGELRSLATNNALWFSFYVRDDDSGIPRGTNGYQTNMNMSIQDFTTNDVVHFYLDGSSADTTASDASNVWLFCEAWSYDQVGEIFGSDGSTNPILVTVPSDTDNDRANDRMPGFTNWQFGLFAVSDDDITGPRARTNTPAFTNHVALQVFAGGDPELGYSGTNIWVENTNDYTNANQRFVTDDGTLAAVSGDLPFMFKAWVFDTLSGLSRSTNDASTNMSLSVGSVIVSNVANFSTNYSAATVGSTMLATLSTNFWVWTNFTAAQIDDLYSAAGHSNLITIHAFDADVDRPGDQASSNIDLGWLIVDDDDTAAPEVGTLVPLRLLHNASFETPGSSATNAFYWEWDNPDRHGGQWGTASRESWRSISGTWEGAVRGSWAVNTNQGGFWQEVTNKWADGTTWWAGGWFWSDWNWTAQTHEVRIEFYDSTTSLIWSVTNSFDAPGENWTWVSVTATSPPSAAWVRFVVMSYGVGANGALQFDDVVLGPYVSQPLAVQAGATNCDIVSGSGTNAIYQVTDGNLATSSDAEPFRFVFAAYDTDSGLSRGTTDTSIHMHVTVTHWTTNNVANYHVYDSTADAGTRTNGAASVWRWNGVGSSVIEALYGVTSRVGATIFDADKDRTSDRSSLLDQQFGYIWVVDDDTNGPTAQDLKVNGAPPSETNYVTDQQLHVGNWPIYIQFVDESGISTQSVGDDWRPNYSLVDPNGSMVLSNYGFEFITTTNYRNFEAWRNWAGAVDYDSVQTGTWYVLWSARDKDEDRSGDWIGVTNSSEITGGTNAFEVRDDDTTAPVAPSNLVVDPGDWTNVNYFQVSWDKATDASGIYQYRVYTNETVPHWTNGFIVSGAVTTNAVGATITNASFEYGSDETQVPAYPDSTNGWRKFSSDGARGYFDTLGTGAQHGTNAMRLEVDTGQASQGGQRYVLVSQYVSINNSNDCSGIVTFKAWFKGDLSESNNGDAATAFLKIELQDENSNTIMVVDNEYDTDHNGRPLHGINTGGNWTNVTVTCTNMPAATEIILFSVGLNNGFSELSYTGWWDNLTATVELVSASGEYGGIFTNAPEGVHTNWLYAVDDDNDRPDDRLMSAVTSFVTKLDLTPPDSVTVTNAEPGPDDTSEIRLQWDPLPDAGGTNLSPWYSYFIYYTDEARDPTTNDPYICFTNGPLVLNTNTTGEAILSNFVYGLTYRLAVVGVDRAGNQSQITSNSIGQVTLSGFYVTQGVVRIYVSTTNAARLAWTAATNELGEVIKAYDLIYVDALDFTEALTSQWDLVCTVTNSYAEDTGSVDRTPPMQLINTMRFYRAAQKDYWRTNRNPRVASREVYVLKTIRLWPGQNWVGLPAVPDTDTVSFVLGHELPASNSVINSTRVQWFDRTDRQVVTQEVWLCDVGLSNQWLYSIPTNLAGNSAEECPVPLYQGFVVEIPTNITSTQVVLFIGELPTNTISQILAGGGYSLVNFNQPHRFGPSQMGLLEAGFQGGLAPPDSDHLWKFDRENQRAFHPIWYRTSDGTWRFTTGGLVPTNYFSPDDSIVIQLMKTGTNLVWTNNLLYEIPTRDMSP